MSKRYALPAGLLGMLFGAVVGLPYLGKTSSCAPDAPQFSCALNNSVGPFIGCIVLGFLVGMAIAHFINSGVDGAVRSIAIDEPATGGGGGAAAVASAERPATARAPKPLTMRAARTEPSPQPSPESRAEPEPKPTPAPAATRGESSLGSRGRPTPKPRRPD